MFGGELQPLGETKQFNFPQVTVFPDGIDEAIYAGAKNHTQGSAYSREDNISLGANLCEP